MEELPPMFDKNGFKESFRVWAYQNRGATPSDAREYCSTQIPAAVYAQHYWLVDQSVEWFKWLKRREEFTREELGDDDECERIVC
jgi:hypothetical protein